MSANETAILVDERPGYAIVTLNRPQKRNAVNRDMQDLLVNVLAPHPARRAIVITGAGEAFCAGVDVKERPNLGGRSEPSNTVSAEFDGWLAVQRAIVQSPAVIIAAVNGYALGGGITLVNCCDLAIASDDAMFGIPELRLGVLPALSGPSTAHRVLPKHLAHMVFTGERIDARTALTFGIVNQVVGHDALIATAVDMAERVSSFDQLAIDYAKKMIRDTATLGFIAAMEHGLALGTLVKSRRQDRVGLLVEGEP
jgi:enoyl-CoA hydratase/carnithine racemase